jgi:hypothetical protein
MVVQVGFVNVGRVAREVASGSLLALEDFYYIIAGGKS